MKYRDSVKRRILYPEREEEWIYIPRFICPKCGHIIRSLPDSVIRFKHYSRETIEEAIAAEQYLYEDYPSDMTIKRWVFQKKHAL